MCFSLNYLSISKKYTIDTLRGNRKGCVKMLEFAMEFTKIDRMFSSQTANVFLK